MIVAQVYRTSCVFSILWSFYATVEALYPLDTATRETRELGGLWWFRSESWNTAGLGFQETWYTQEFATTEDVIKMPVPSSYNDITQSIALRDMVGWVWYQREFFVPQSWSSQRIVLRFESVNYFASIWLGDDFLGNHTGGHLPFEFEIGDLVSFSTPNRLTVAVNNTLNHATIPHGEFQYKSDKNWYPEGFFDQTVDFDFFNYAGINRAVKLYTTPVLYIADIVITTTISDTSGFVAYSISVAGQRTTDFELTVNLYDKQRKLVANHTGSEGNLTVPNAHFWWPRGSNKEVAYLYELEVILTVDTTFAGFLSYPDDVEVAENLRDVYQLAVGIRTVKVTSTQFLINGVPFYFKGFGMHEDSDIRGRGYDAVVMTKDLNLLEWSAGNSFRTSHYPYSEERMFETDRRGIVVIDETPAVGLQYFTDENLQLHKSMLRQMIERDRNHPSVVMWSIANEPHSSINASRDYFKFLVELAHRLDSTRPVDIVYGPTDYNDELSGSFVDVLCINRYYGWYSEMGRLDAIQTMVTQDLTQWNQKFRKPIIVTEYGAGSIPGINADPPADFSESYQVAFMSQYHTVFDKLRSKWLIGEMVWNFADFQTQQAVNRVNGNRKGVFTRNRQPKMAAYVLKQRYACMNGTIPVGHDTSCSSASADARPFMLSEL